MFLLQLGTQAHLKGWIIGVILGVVGMFTVPVAIAVYQDPEARADLLSNISDSIPTVNEKQDISDIERDIHTMINGERQKAGLEALDWDGELATIARDHSKNMATFDFVDHRDQNGRSAPDRYRLAGYGCPWGGPENVFYYGAETDDFAERAVDSWMDSSLHRKNILTAQFQNEGIGVAIGENGMYATQNFC